MRAIRMRSDASIAVLIIDVFVLWFALGAARDTEAPAWMRLVCLVAAVLAATFAVHSLVVLVRRRSA